MDLEHALERIELLERELEGTLGALAGVQIVLDAVIRTHPRYDDFQLAATSGLELAMNRMPLTQRGRATAHSVAEAFLKAQPTPPGAQRDAIGALVRGATRKG